MPNDIFYIIGSKGRFYRGYEERGYLPPWYAATEPVSEDNSPNPEIEKLTNQVNMLHGQVLYLNHKLNEHLEKGKPKQKARRIQGIEL